MDELEVKCLNGGNSVNAICNFDPAALLESSAFALENVLCKHPQPLQSATAGSNSIVLWLVSHLVIVWYNLGAGQAGSYLHPIFRKSYWV